MVTDNNQSLPGYRLITGKDDADFCLRVSEMLRIGYKLYGNPAMTYNHEEKKIIVAQAVIMK